MELQEFLSSFASQLDDTDISEITATTIFHELEEWSSLTAMMIIAFVKKKYDKVITGAEIKTCTTLNDLFILIESK